MKFDFLMLSVNVLAVSHSLTLYNSELTTSSRVRRFLSAYNRFVSSANKKNASLADDLWTPLAYKRNSKGPKTDPCGTPQRGCLLEI